MNNRLHYILVLFFIIIVIIIINCTGNQVGDTDVCPESENALDCLIINNESIPPFHTEFDMLFAGGGEQQNLFGKAYVDSKKQSYYIELKTLDILVFKGKIIGDDMKILYRTDTDSFEGIVGKLSKLRLEKYTNLDFDIETLLKVISLKIPVFNKYDTFDIENTGEKQEYILTKDNIQDKIIFYEQIPMVKYLVRGIYFNSDFESSENKIQSAFSYRYYDRAYKKETFNGKTFYYSQKTSLTYYFMVLKDGEVKKDERKITIGLRNNTTFSEGFEDSVYEFDFPEGITIHYEN